MSTFILDTLDYATKLKAGGFSEQQAETQARALAEIIDRQIATKTDVTERENGLRSDIEASRVELKRDIEASRVELKRDLREVELRMEARLAETKADLTRWVVGAGILQTSLIVGVLLTVAKLI